jgi:hypothetical protein
MFRFVTNDIMATFCDTCRKGIYSLRIFKAILSSQSESFMALEGTHVRFALDLMPLLKIDDIGAYCAGAVYPDTRYVTRVDRGVTHGPDCPHDPFAEGLSDFQRGWASHLLYDHEAGGAMKTFLSPEIGPLAQGSLAWVEFTAMKVVEDLEAIRNAPEVLERLQSLSIPAAPSGEPLEKLQYHFSVTSKLYQSAPSLDGYRQWFIDIGAPKELSTGIATQARKMLDNIEYSANLTAIYQRVFNAVLVAQRSKTA